ncbi:MAG TPA: glycoside hydrolase family 5 protein [Anaerolineales bacterium]|nr:glycoside hydrolase family 5 protein [Anaerolineales bacterium]
MPPTSTSTPEPTTTPVPSTGLRRGINMGNMLEAPDEGQWGLTIQEEYFDLIKEAGFDFVRLPVRWNTHAAQESPYTIDSAFFTRVDEVVDWALERDLAIIVDFHHYEEMMWDPWSHKDRYLGIWKQVAEHYKDYPSNVLFELLNEPNDQLNASLWNQYLVEALVIVRETNPTRDLVIGPTSWNAYDWVSTLDVPDDEHLIVTFHYYLPFQFTHQGAEWVSGSDPWLGTTWDATDSEKAEITAHVDSVAEWAKRHDNVRILLGEFGAYSKADMDSRVRWTAYVSREAERHGFAWAYWEFAAGFGIYDPAAKLWREDLLQALIP